MRKAAGEWEAVAATDPLTELANWRAFDSGLPREWLRAIRARAPIALLMADADHFKRYNDHDGHPMGDAVLQGIASCIKLSLRRPADLGSRIGGEEFAVLLPGTDLSGAVTIAERIRVALSQLDIPHAEHPGGRVTISIGVAVMSPSVGDTQLALVAQADKALYAARTAGRNRVSIAFDDIPPLASDVLGEAI